MLAMAAQAGVQTHKRAPEYCDEKTKTFGEWSARCRVVTGDEILWATCTAPLVFPKLYARRSSSMSTRSPRASIPS